jgi:hypothetical protein
MRVKAAMTAVLPELFAPMRPVSPSLSLMVVGSGPKDRKFWIVIFSAFMGGFESKLEQEAENI